MGICDRSGPGCDLDLRTRFFYILALDNSNQAEADVLRALVQELFVRDVDSRKAEAGLDVVGREGRRIGPDLAGGFVDVVPDNPDGGVTSGKVGWVPCNCDASAQVS